MSGVSMHVHLDDRDLETGLLTLLRKSRDMRPALRDIGEMLVSSTHERFENEEDPEGNSWTPSRRAKDDGGQTLSVSGRLRNSITSRVSAIGVEVGTNVKYAAIHQFGGEIKPKTAAALVFEVGDRLVFARKVQMPARPYLGISDDDRQEAIDIVKDYLELS